MSESEVIHWLFGKVELNEPVEAETDCEDCIHYEVCVRRMSEFCVNYEFGTNERVACDGCVHRHTRWGERQPILCFKCKHFEERE